MTAVATYVTPMERRRRQAAVRREFGGGWERTEVAAAVAALNLPQTNDNEEKDRG